MTRDELRTAVRNNLGGNRGDKDTIIDQALDLGIKALARKYHWRDLKDQTDLSLLDTTLSFTDGVWDESALTLTKTGAFASYTREAGDFVRITDGTGVSTGLTEVSSNTDDALTLATTISTSAATDVTATEIISTTKADLPSDFGSLVEARYINGTASWPLEHKTKQWLTDRWPNISSLSKTKPEKCYIENDDLFLFPTVDDNYTIRITYVKEPTNFASDIAENPIPVLDLALIAWGTYYLLLHLEKFQAAGVWLSLSDQQVLEAIRSDKRLGVKFQYDAGRTVVTDAANPNSYLDPFAGHPGCFRY